MGIIPGHYYLEASATATTLCTLVRNDLRSQFYKTPPIRESSPTVQPSWSRGKEKVIYNQERSASRRQALEAREYARNVATRPAATTSSTTPSQNQERPRINDDIHQEAKAQEPTYEEIVVRGHVPAFIDMVGQENNSRQNGFLYMVGQGLSRESLCPRTWTKMFL